MNIVEIITAIVMLVVSLLLVVIITAQKNRGEGLGAGFGGVGFEGTRGKTSDMILSKWTKILGIVFAVLIIATNIIVFVVK